MEGLLKSIQVEKHWIKWLITLTNIQWIPWGLSSHPSRARWTQTPAVCVTPRFTRWSSRGLVSPYPIWQGPSKQKATGTTQSMGLEQEGKGREAPLPWSHCHCSRIPVSEECRQCLTPACCPGHLTESLHSTCCTSPFIPLGSGGAKGLRATGK